MTVISGSFSATDRTRDPDEQFAEIRQSVVDSLHQTLDSAKHAALFPTFLIEAIENEVWARPRRLTHNIVPAMSLAEFIKKPYPVGLGTSVDMIEKLIAGDTAAKLAWKQVRPQASQTIGNVDQIQVSRCAQKLVDLILEQYEGGQLPKLVALLKDGGDDELVAALERVIKLADEHNAATCTSCLRTGG